MKTIKVIIVTGGLILTSSFKPTGEWYSVEKKDCGFKIEFPAKPKTKVWKTIPEMNMFYKTYEFHSTVKNKKDENRYWVYYTKYPDFATNSDKMNKKALENFYRKKIDYYLTGEGDKLLSEKPISLKGHSGKELQILITNKSYAYNGKPHIDILRMFLIKNNLYIIQVSADPKTNSITQSMNHFLDSFDLTNS